MELWKDIVGFEGIYQISTYGRLKSFKVNTEGYVLKNTNNKGGYLSVILDYRNNRRISTRIHRLVAEAFIPNPDHLPEINHINGNKQNNHNDNLEWCTRRHNVRDAIKRNPNIIRGMNIYNKYIRPRTIIQYSLDGRPLALFCNSVEASKATGVCHRNILQVASKDEYRPGLTRKQAGGFKWEYI